MQQLARLFAASLAAGLASLALGAIKVEFRSTTGCSTCFTDITSSVTVDGSRNVTINGPNAGTYRIYSTAASTESLGVITFTGSAATFNLFVSPNATAFDESQQFASSACNGWAGLNPGVCHVTLQARFTGNLTGTIAADRIVRLDTSGSINAKVDQDPASGSPLLAAIVAGGSITAQINAFKGNIGTVWCFSHLSGSVNTYAQDATINLVEVGTPTLSANLTGAINSFAGSIGSVVVHGDINNGTAAANIRALKGIGLVESNTITSSFISANWDGTSSTHDGRIGRIETLTGNCNAIIQASTISDSSPGNGIFIAGNCTKEIGFNSANNPSNPLPINKPIVIGGNLENGGLVTMDGDFTSVLRINGALNGDIRLRKSRFLTGQIIINGAAANNGAWGPSRVRFMDRVNAQQQNVSFDIGTNSSAPYQAPTRARTRTRP
ncbi:MAG: hypothetical protein IT432_10185 [Phycisphaerales bacterium]|nr:hypothetical protein [Phycisphaerales bacterium]